jgi:hypothetical protein
MSKPVNVTPAKPVAWRPNVWRQSVPLSNSQVREFIRDGVIPSVRIGGARMITESPEAFIERHRDPRSA